MSPLCAAHDRSCLQITARRQFRGSEWGEWPKLRGKRQDWKGRRHYLCRSEIANGPIETYTGKFPGGKLDDMSTSASPQKISVRWTFLLLGWGLAAVAWGTYFYLQQQRPTTDDTGFVRFLVAGGVVFSFWLVAVPIVGRLAMRLPITGPAGSTTHHG